MIIFRSASMNDHVFLTIKDLLLLLLGRKISVPGLDIKLGFARPCGEAVVYWLQRATNAVVAAILEPIRVARRRKEEPLTKNSKVA